MCIRDSQCRFRQSVVVYDFKRSLKTNSNQVVASINVGLRMSVSSLINIMCSFYCDDIVKSSNYDGCYFVSFCLRFISCVSFFSFCNSFANCLKLRTFPYVFSSIWWHEPINQMILHTLYSQMIWHTPVSYTHLDVYKRQPLTDLHQNLKALSPLQFTDVCKKLFDSIWICGCYRLP